MSATHRRARATYGCNNVPLPRSAKKKSTFFTSPMYRLFLANCQPKNRELVQGDLAKNRRRRVEYAFGRNLALDESCFSVINRPFVVIVSCKSGRSALHRAAYRSYLYMSYSWTFISFCSVCDRGAGFQLLCCLPFV